MLTIIVKYVLKQIRKFAYFARKVLKHLLPLVKVVHGILVCGYLILVHFKTVDI